MNLQENPSSGSHQDMRGSTNRHDDVNSHISSSGITKRKDHKTATDRALGCSTIPFRCIYVPRQEKTTDRQRCIAVIVFKYLYR
jgi:hypothetical protein